MEEKSLYLVLAYKWNDSDLHSYPVGIYTTPSSAISSATHEMNETEGKYSCRVYKTAEDSEKMVLYHTVPGTVFNKTTFELDKYNLYNNE